VTALYVLQNRTDQDLDLAGVVARRWRQTEVPFDAWTDEVRAAVLQAEARGQLCWFLVAGGRPVMRGNEAAALAPVIGPPSSTDSEQT
jgi:hypothetical protein